SYTKNNTEHNMKPILQFNLLLTILLLISCGQPTGIPEQAAKTVYAKSTWLPAEEASVVMIYDVHPQLARLEYRAVRVKKSSGHPLKDLVNTFLLNNSIEHPSSDLNLSGLSEKDGKAILTFKGKARFANQRDSLLFWKALNITLARNDTDQKFEFEY
ncbi:MAG: hypothetical protein AAF985_13605, partial [Bacteroidota bacterium]